MPTYHGEGELPDSELEPSLELGKCLHLYFYVQHPRLVCCTCACKLGFLS